MATTRLVELKDEKLMRRAAAGCRRSFEALVRRHVRRAVNIAYRYVQSAAIAEDIAQEAFLRLWRNRSSYRPDARFTTFLYRVIANLCISHHRSASRRPEVHVSPQDEDTTYFSLPSEVEEPLVGLERRELAEAVRAAVAALPGNQRMAFLLLRYQGLSYNEIAEVMDTSVQAVKSLLVRARARLRERLERYLGG